MGRFSLDRSSHWEIAFYLVFDDKGNVRLTRGEPDLNRNERSMSMVVNVPKVMFKLPTLRATMTIEAPEPLVSPIDLTAAAASMKQALGVDVDMRVVEPE